MFESRERSTFADAVAASLSAPRPESVRRWRERPETLRRLAVSLAEAGPRTPGISSAFELHGKPSERIVAREHDCGGSSASRIDGEFAGHARVGFVDYLLTDGEFWVRSITAFPYRRLSLLRAYCAVRIWRRRYRR